MANKFTAAEITAPRRYAIYESDFGSVAKSLFCEAFTIYGAGNQIIGFTTRVEVAVEFLNSGKLDSYIPYTRCSEHDINQAFQWMGILMSA